MEKNYVAQATELPRIWASQYAHQLQSSSSYILHLFSFLCKTGLYAQDTQIQKNTYNLYMLPSTCQKFQSVSRNGGRGNAEVTEKQPSFKLENSSICSLILNIRSYWILFKMLT